MKEVKRTLNKQEFPNVIAAYGDKAAEIAEQTAVKLGIEPTEVNLNSILMNLESDLESDRLMSGYDPDEEYPDED